VLLRPIKYKIVTPSNLINLKLAKDKETRIIVITINLIIVIIEIIA